MEKQQKENIKYWLYIAGFFAALILLNQLVR